MTALELAVVVCAGILIYGLIFIIASHREKYRRETETRALADAMKRDFREESERSRLAIQGEIAEFRKEFSEGSEMRSRTLNETLSARSRETNETLLKQLGLLAETQSKQSEFIAGSLAANRTEIAKTFAEIRQALETSLTRLRDENTKKLDEMRNVVDEKLQTTLEKRIGESFKLVNAQLESLNKSFGEMQTVAASVGDLKRVLTNVKSRGTWGEVQLGALIENMLTPEQFARNVKPNPRGNATVEFAVKLPGTDANENRPLYLPIDSKFPNEDYERIVAAAENADENGVESAAAKLAKVVESCARDIREKYICPPYTTNFAVLFLPTEGLYAEVLRRPGLAEKIQREYRVLIAGPTTLAALLNSLQMGFRTLMIQKNSAEIAKTLSGVKTEFSKFGELLAKVGKKLGEAQNTIEDTANRHRIAMGKLSKVETLEIEEKAVPAAETLGDGMF